MPFPVFHEPTSPKLGPTELKLESDANPEHSLLGPDAEAPAHGGEHATKTAPVFTEDVLRALGPDVFPQRGFYGRVVEQRADGLPLKPIHPGMYINTNAPFSALVCGVQGSGKSHSTAVLLESCLIKDERLGSLPAPLSGLIFHFDTAAGGGAVQPSEAAYLANLDSVRGLSAVAPKVVVLVLPSNLRAMQEVYAELPNVSVEPLHFASTDISAERLLAMMKVNSGEAMPLYMETIMSLLRTMGDEFSYAAFRKMLQEQEFDKRQMAMLSLRLSLLESCIGGGTDENRVGRYFELGQLTIIDLSSPFMDAASACGFFDMILGLFIEADIPSGKIIVLDEAHKYLADDGSSAKLTESLLGVVRQQRHFNARVVVSTQEPTVVPDKFLGLCSFILAHRFSSPRWVKHLSQDVAVAGEYEGEWARKIVALKTGQALLFAPAGLGLRIDNTLKALVSGESGTDPFAAQLGQGYLLVQSRLRITRDGGHTLLAVADAAHTRVRRATPPADVKKTPTPQSAPAALPSPAASPAQRPARLVPRVPPRFAPLVRFLAGYGRDWVLWSVLGSANKNKNIVPAGSMRKFLQEAAELGLVELSAWAGGDRVRLTEE